MESPKIKNLTETLYEQDYCLWLDLTASLLRDGRLSELDIPNLIEEIEDMGRSHKDALESNLRVVLMHLLNYKYQHSKRSNSWRGSIREHRIRINKAFRNSPSLKRYFQEVFNECYQDARKIAADETGLPLDTFPVQSPFTSEEAFNHDYLPD
jgi:cellulose biosynthesis protein BcsQ